MSFQSGIINPFNSEKSTGSQSGTQYTYYSEGGGNRFYVNRISSTASSEMESATFQSFLSFTMSGNLTYSFDLIPMDTGESAVINTIVYAQNSSGTKGFTQKAFGAWRHSGSTLACVGGSMDLTNKTDFTTVAVSWTASATQSIKMTVVGQTSETIDWDVHINYTKGYHDILTGTTNPQKPIYPSSPSATS